MTEETADSLDHHPVSSVGVPAAVFLLVLLVVFPLMHHRGEQQASRLALTAAVWDQATLEVTRYAELLGRDGAVFNGVVYSDKAPGQPLLAVPLYGAYRVAGGEPVSAASTDPDLALWWVTLWSAGVPLAVLAVLMYRWSREVEPGTALAATLTLALGSLLLVYGTLLFAHVLAALFGFGMFLLVRRPEASRRRLLAAGLLGGLAVLVEFPLVLIVAVVTIAAFVVHRERGWAVVAGGIPAVAALGLYNWSLFGSPMVVSYQWSSFSGIRDQAADTFEIFAGPTLERAIHVLVSERGLLVATPVIAIAFAGLWLMWRRGRHVDSVVALLAFTSMLAIQFSWGNSYAGGAGPRYITPGLPFLAAPLALAWGRWRVLTLGLALVGVLTLGLATVTNPQLGSHFSAGMGYWLGELVNGNVAPMLYSEMLGVWGWLIYAATVLSGLALVRVASISQNLELGESADQADPATPLVR